jgi:hypothetical protein
MAMVGTDIERLLKEAFPAAHVIIVDLAGEGDHFAARVTGEAFRARAGFSSTRWSMTPCGGPWTARSTLWPSKPIYRNDVYRNDTYETAVPE